MNNFLEFIIKDTEAKMTLITSLPTKTKTNKKDYSSELASITKKYNSYKEDVEKYLIAKSHSFNVKKPEPRTQEILDQINELESIINYLNPYNTFFEKLGFGDLIYQLRKSFTFNFNSLNDVINGLLDKFDLVGITLTEKDFNYTCFVNEYMSSFLEVRYSDNQSYKKVSEVFDKVYWVNPELIQHIELNFRKLIRDNKKTFSNYVSDWASKECKRLNIRDYDDALEKLRIQYLAYYEDQKEDIYEIVEGAKNGDFDINQYLEDNKVRINAYTSIIDSSVDYNDISQMNKVCATLESFKLNVMEYENYNKFKNIFVNFADEFKSLIGTSSKGYKGLDNVNSQIASKEKELEKLNHKISSGRRFFSQDKDNKVLKAKSVNIAKEIYELYSNYDEEYFKVNVLKILDETISVADVLTLYESFPFFKMMAIEKAFDKLEYEDILKLGVEFEKFTLNPSNVIVSGVPVFSECNVARVIANKCKLHGLNITESELTPDGLDSLLSKMLLILRVNVINNSELDLSKVWFMVKVNKIENADKEDKK